MSATEDVARMLALVPWLLARDAPTVEETRAAFGISEQQLREDVERLNFCGLPGFRGGDLFECDLIGDRIVLRMADELRRPLRLGPAEAVRLVLLVQTALSILDGDLGHLRSGLEKLRRAAGVPPTIMVDVEPEAVALGRRLRTAVAQGHRVSFDYQGRADDAPRRRTVDPWAVHVEGGQLYLQGHDLDAGAGRSFRLDRIGSLEVTTEPRQHQAPARLRPPGYEPADDDLRVSLELAPSARWLAEALDPDEVTERRSGGARVVVHTDAPVWLERLVLQAAGGARITAPKALREQVRSRVDAALARYDGPDAPSA